jgi:hypothetical protein
MKTSTRNKVCKAPLLTLSLMLTSAGRWVFEFEDIFTSNNLLWISGPTWLGFKLETMAKTEVFLWSCCGCRCRRLFRLCLTEHWLTFATDALNRLPSPCHGLQVLTFHLETGFECFDIGWMKKYGLGFRVMKRMRLCRFAIPFLTLVLLSSFLAFKKKKTDTCFRSWGTIRAIRI